MTTCSLPNPSAFNQSPLTPSFPRKVYPGIMPGSEGNRFRSKETSDEMSDAILVAAAQSGDDVAFVELCNRHSDRILRTLYQITKNREDAEDALQDSFLKAFTHIHKFEGRSLFSSWLTRIAINSALMLLRKRRSRNEIPIEIPSDGERPELHYEIVDPNEDPEAQYARLEKSERLRMEILRLRPRFRSVVELHQFQECSAAEIADTLSISVAAVKSRLLRARAALRKSTFRKKTPVHGYMRHSQTRQTYSDASVSG
jgi:RNA polymerase sigma-70 factor, ECF subfamily